MLEINIPDLRSLSDQQLVLGTIGTIYILSWVWMRVSGCAKVMFEDPSDANMPAPIRIAFIVIMAPLVFLINSMKLMLIGRDSKKLAGVRTVPNEPMKEINLETKIQQFLLLKPILEATFDWAHNASLKIDAVGQKLDGLIEYEKDCVLTYDQEEIDKIRALIESSPKINETLAEIARLKEQFQALNMSLTHVIRMATSTAQHVDPVPPISTTDGNQGWVRFLDHWPEIGRPFNWKAGNHLWTEFSGEPQVITRHKDDNLKRDDGRIEIVSLSDISDWSWRYV